VSDKIYQCNIENARDLVLETVGFFSLGSKKLAARFGKRATGIV
jgi:hypothetical protein